jgi:hypothetical protein
MRLVNVICFAAVLVTCLPTETRADVWSRKAILTFSDPVQVPGMMLPAGTYLFRLADLDVNRRLVQIFDKDEKHIYRTILAILNTRLQPGNTRALLFSERPTGSPQAVRAWFYPGESIANEFVYPSNQAMRIAKETHQAVLTTDDRPRLGATEAERMNVLKAATISRLDETGQSRVVAAEETARTSSSRGGNDIAVGTGGQAADAAAESASPETRTGLPVTAGSLAIFEWLLGLTLAGWLGVRRLRIYGGR